MLAVLVVPAQVVAAVGAAVGAADGDLLLSISPSSSSSWATAAGNTGVVLALPERMAVGGDGKWR